MFDIYSFFTLKYLSLIICTNYPLHNFHCFRWCGHRNRDEQGHSFLNSLFVVERENKFKKQQKISVSDHFSCLLLGLGTMLKMELALIRVSPGMRKTGFSLRLISSLWQVCRLIIIHEMKLLSLVWPV